MFEQQVKIQCKSRKYKLEEKENNKIIYQQKG